MANGNGKGAMNTLAVVGFGALLVAGILLAVYAARHVPEALSRLSSAVFLSTDGERNGGTETPSAPEAPSAPATTTQPAATTTPSTPAPSAARTGGPLYYPQAPRVVVSQPQLYGLPDLVLTDVRGGYFRGSTFVEDDEVPANRDAAVRFTVRNTGTNVATGWRVRVEVTGEDTAVGGGGMLMPNGYQNFTLRIENPEEDRRIRINIEVDDQNRVAESNERNNSASLRLDIDD